MEKQTKTGKNNLGRIPTLRKSNTLLNSYLPISPVVIYGNDYRLRLAGKKIELGRGPGYYLWRFIFRMNPRY